MPMVGRVRLAILMRRPVAGDRRRGEAGPAAIPAWVVCASAGAR